MWLYTHGCNAIARVLAVILGGLAVPVLARLLPAGPAWQALPYPAGVAVVVALATWLLDPLGNLAYLRWIRAVPVTFRQARRYAPLLSPFGPWYPMPELDTVPVPARPGYVEAMRLRVDPPGGLGMTRHELDAQLRHVRRLRAWVRAGRDPTTLAGELHRLARGLVHLRMWSEALDAGAEQVAICRWLAGTHRGDPVALGRAVHLLAVCCATQAQFDRAVTLCGEAVALLGAERDRGRPVGRELRRARAQLRLWTTVCPVPGTRR
jgi:hypothetical protein